MTSINKVGVLGSGIMGSGLAEVVARAGIDVVVRSRTQAGADAVLAKVGSGLARHVAKLSLCLFLSISLSLGQTPLPRT